MADAPVVHIGENSPERIAYLLVIDVMNADKIPRTGTNILKAYFHCIRTVRGASPPDADKFRSEFST